MGFPVPLLLFFVAWQDDSPQARAYKELEARNYESAIAAFRRAVNENPQRGDLRKDLAYTLLKTGETAAARDQFREVLMVIPDDLQSALEYGYLCYETGEKIAARRTFDRLRQLPNARAEEAFESIDRPLREGIERWKAALAVNESFSAHEELAKLAEQRDELDLAAEHYEKAWRMRPEMRGLLLDLGRVWRQTGRKDEAFTALLAASRGGEPRAAERARALLPARYPYVYEFQKALQFDPSNSALRRELAYLHLAMEQKAEAEREFREIVRRAPDDLLSVAQLGFLLLGRGDRAAAMPLLERVLASGEEELADRVRKALEIPQTFKKREETPKPAVSAEAKELAARSLEKSYLQDALKYLKIANENDPRDYDVMLKLGWTHNMTHQDGEALRWFGMARKSPDPHVAGEADRAWKNLRPAFSRFRTTAWMFPLWSSRWRDVFAYGQVKTEMNLPRLPLRAYVSTRMVGDVRGQATTSAGLGPQQLSENSAIVALGLATSAYKGLLAWFEAGEAMRIRDGGSWRMKPDFRGGVSYSKGFGHLLARGSQGWFGENNSDGLFVSRFGNDFLMYGQNRAGYTLRAPESGHWQTQLFWNANLTVDARRQAWANFAETGPGVRVKLPGNLLLTASLLRGSYFERQEAGRPPNFWDVRVGIWYAYTVVH